MDARRFDALSRALASRATRRGAVLSGLVVALTGLGLGQRGSFGRNQEAASPAATPDASPGASPVASPAAPGLLDLLGGSPPAGDDALGRYSCGIFKHCRKDNANIGELPGGPVPCCYAHGRPTPCVIPGQQVPTQVLGELNDRCNATYPECEGRCYIYG